jgi:hypothetical protein
VKAATDFTPALLYTYWLASAFLPPLVVLWRWGFTALQFMAAFLFLVILAASGLNLQNLDQRVFELLFIPVLGSFIVAAFISLIDRMLEKLQRLRAKLIQLWFGEDAR